MAQELSVRLTADPSQLLGSFKDVADAFSAAQGRVRAWGQATTEAGRAAETSMQRAVAAFAGLDKPLNDARVSAEVFRDSLDASDAVNRLIASMDPAVAASQRYERAQQEVARAVSLGAITQEEANRALALAKAQYEATGQAALLAGQRAGQGAQIGAHHVQNLAFQFNDIGMMLAAGQSPLMLAMQQGTQVAQVLGPMGAAGAARALAQGFMAFLNPMTLVTVGSIAAGAAMIQWLTGAGDEAETLEDRFKGITDAMDDYAAAARDANRSDAELFADFGRAANEAQRYFDVRLAIAKFEAEAASRRASRAIMQPIEDQAARIARQQQAAGIGDGTAIPAITTGSLRDLFNIEDFQAARALEQAIRQLNAAKPGEESARAILRVQAALIAATGGYENMNEAAREYNDTVMAGLRSQLDFAAAAEEAGRRAVAAYMQYQDARRQAVEDATSPFTSFFGEWEALAQSGGGPAAMEREIDKLAASTERVVDMLDRAEFGGPAMDAARSMAQRLQDRLADARSNADALNAADLSGLEQGLRALLTIVDGLFGGLGLVRGQLESFTPGSLAALSGTPSGDYQRDLVAAATQLAQQRGISVEDLLTVIGFETAGTFSGAKLGPHTEWGQHIGLIQMGEPQRAQFGYDPLSGNAFEQMAAVDRYFQAHGGLRPGDDLAQIYSMVLTGGRGNFNSGDRNNGGVVNSVWEATRPGGQLDQHRPAARELIELYGADARRAADEHEAFVGQMGQAIDRGEAEDEAARLRAAGLLSAEQHTARLAQIEADRAARQTAAAAEVERRAKEAAFGAYESLRASMDPLRAAQLAFAQGEQVVQAAFEAGTITIQERDDALKMLLDRMSSEQVAIATQNIIDGMSAADAALAETIQTMRADLSGGISSGFETFFVDLITGAKSAGDAFQALGDTIIATFARILAERFTERFITPLADALAGAIFPAGGNFLTGRPTGGAPARPTGAVGAALTSIIGPYAKGGVFAADDPQPFAKGGVLEAFGEVVEFAKGGTPAPPAPFREVVDALAPPPLSAHSGQVVDRPTLFGLADGRTGLMGEAGAEAIMPLTHGTAKGVGAVSPDGGETTLPLARLASGKLGVVLPDDGPPPLATLRGLAGALVPPLSGPVAPAPPEPRAEVVDAVRATVGTDRLPGALPVFAPAAPVPVPPAAQPFARGGVPGDREDVWRRRLRATVAVVPGWAGELPPLSRWEARQTPAPLPVPSSSVPVDLTSPPPAAPRDERRPPAPDAPVIWWRDVAAAVAKPLADGIAPASRLGAPSAPAAAHRPSAQWTRVLADAQGAPPRPAMRDPFAGVAAALASPPRPLPATLVPEPIVLPEPMRAAVAAMAAPNDPTGLAPSVAGVPSVPLPELRPAILDGPAAMGLQPVRPERAEKGGQGDGALAAALGALAKSVGRSAPKVTVINNAGRDVEVTAAPSSQGGDVMEIVVNRVKGALMQDARDGGDLSRALAGTFGLLRQGR
jgi:hypothetical protein